MTIDPSPLFATLPAEKTNPLVHVDGVLAGHNVRNGGALLRLLSLRGGHRGALCRRLGNVLGRGGIGGCRRSGFGRGFRGGRDGRGCENVWAENLTSRALRVSGRFFAGVHIARLKFWVVRARGAGAVGHSRLSRDDIMDDVWPLVSAELNLKRQQWTKKD